MSSRATSIAITRPSLPTSMPRTPVVSRPIERASDSAKRTVSPARETMITSSPGSTARTASSSSSSRMLIAMIPSALIGVLYACSSVFLTVPLRVANTRYFGLGEVARGDDRLDPLALAQRQDVDERAALRGALRLGQLVDLRAVDLAAVGEEQQVVVRGAHEQVLDEVAVLHVHARHAAPAALLLAVGGERQRLDVAGLRDRDHHLLVGDQVLDVDLVLGVADLRAPLVAEALGDLRELLLDDGQHAALVAEDRAQLGDPLAHVGVLLFDAVGLERGQLRQAQVEDRRRLDRR